MFIKKQIEAIKVKAKKYIEFVNIEKNKTARTRKNFIKIISNKLDVIKADLFEECKRLLANQILI